MLSPSFQLVFWSLGTGGLEGQHWTLGTASGGGLLLQITALHKGLQTDRQTCQWQSTGAHLGPEAEGRASSSQSLSAKPGMVLCAYNPSTQEL